MKKWKWMMLVCAFSIVCTACGGNKEENEAENVTTEESTTEEAYIEEKAEIEKYTLSSETEDVSIEIGIPAIFEQTEYSSESWLALEIPGENENSSTQLMMYLEADESVDVKKNMVEEVNYLMSANTDDWEELDYVEGVSAECYEWSYVTYELEGLVGYKFCADMQNGSVLAGTIEDIGNSSEAFNFDEFIQQIDKDIVTE